MLRNERLEIKEMKWGIIQINEEEKNELREINQ